MFIVTLFSEGTGVETGFSAPSDAGPFSIKQGADISLDCMIRSLRHKAGSSMLRSSLALKSRRMTKLNFLTCRATPAREVARATSRVVSAPSFAEGFHYATLINSCSKRSLRLLKAQSRLLDGRSFGKPLARFSSKPSKDAKSAEKSTEVSEKPKMMYWDVNDIKNAGLNAPSKKETREAAMSFNQKLQSFVSKCSCTDACPPAN